MGIWAKIKSWIFGIHCLLCRTKLDPTSEYVIVQYRCLDGYDNLYLCTECAKDFDEAAFDTNTDPSAFNDI